MRDAVRVALLARPGAGGDRLREALRAAGADLVLDADPTTLEPATLADAGAESVVVLLDGAVEEALDRLDPVLHDPAIDVLYEESEVAAAREGWDVARWTRHLSAKLLHHGDVLPPGREADAAPVARAAPASPPAPAAGPMSSLADEPALAPPAMPAPAPPAEPPPESPAPSMFDPVSAEFDPAGHDPAGQVPVEIEPLEFDSDTFDLDEAADPVPEPPTGLPSPEVPAAGTAPVAPPPAPNESPLTLSLEGSDDATPPAPPAAPAATSGQRSDALRDFRRDLASIEQRIASMGLVDADPAAEAAPGEPAPAPVAAKPGEPSLFEPALADPDPVPQAAPGVPAAAPAPPVAPSAASTPAPVPAAGAVLVFAGIGGPDAVRQFLGALPAGFPRPVLIHQRLDGGRHDRLVQQMARATSLPVQLAADGEPVTAGHVYILPPGLGLEGGAAGLRFVAGGDALATLPPGESAVLMFSGSDTALVDAAMGHAQGGALVAGQSPDDCYDAAAADALVARGAESGQPADLARRLADRWAA